MSPILAVLLISLSAVSANPIQSHHIIDATQDISSHVYSLVTNSRLRIPFFNGRNANRHRREVDQANPNNDDQITLYEISSNDEDLEGPQCVLLCTNQLKRASQPFQQATPTSNLSKHLHSHLNRVCTALRPAIQCFDRCGPSALHSTLSISLEPIKYICIDRFNDLKGNMRCMQKLASTTTAQCSARCQDHEPAVTQLRQLAADQRNAEVPRDRAQQLLTGTCQYIQCFLQCSLPMTRSACGDTAADITAGIAQRMMASLENFDNLTRRLLPDECKRLSQTTNYESDNQQPSALSPESNSAIYDDGPEGQPPADRPNTLILDD